MHQIEAICRRLGHRWRKRALGPGITLRSIPQDVVLSVECGTLDQAARSIEHLRTVVR
jgi:hypothetical protein